MSWCFVSAHLWMFPLVPPIQKTLKKIIGRATKQIMALGKSYRNLLSNDVRATSKKCLLVGSTIPLWLNICIRHGSPWTCPMLTLRITNPTNFSMLSLWTKVVHFKWVCYSYFRIKTAPVKRTEMMYYFNVRGTVTGAHSYDHQWGSLMIWHYY